MEDKICLDTDILIDLLHKQDYAVEFIRKHQGKSKLCLSIISLFELYVGAFGRNRLQYLQDVEGLAEEFMLLELSIEGVREAGRISASLRGKGEMLEHKDVLIAATAKVNGCSLKTGNIKHFKRIEGLRVL